MGIQLVILTGQGCGDPVTAGCWCNQQALSDEELSVLCHPSLSICIYRYSFILLLIFCFQIGRGRPVWMRTVASSTTPSCFFAVSPPFFTSLHLVFIELGISFPRRAILASYTGSHPTNQYKTSEITLCHVSRRLYL